MKNQLFQVFWVMGTAMTLLLTGCKQVIEYLPPLPEVEMPSANLPQLPQVAQSDTNDQIEISVTQLINQRREDKQLPPLEHNEKLAQVARNYSQQMAENNFFSHTGIDGSTLEDRVKAGGIIYSVVGENIFQSTNIPQPAEVAVDGWMQSPGHRENILRPVFTETGVGVWRVNNTYYITQLFLRP